MSIQPPLAGKLRLDRTLESAILLSWKDLMPETVSSGRIHLEYQIRPNGSANDLQIWLSTLRGYWKLICKHCMSCDSSRTSGVKFINSYSSARLAHILELIVQQQDRFSTSSESDRAVLIQVQAPTQDEVIAARNYIHEVFGDIRPSRSN